MLKGQSNRRDWRHVVVSLSLVVGGVCGIQGVASAAVPQALPEGMGMLAQPERMQRMVEHLLDVVEASPAQRAQIQHIAQETAADLKPQMDDGRAWRQKARQIMTAPVVDASALEALRQEKMARHDVVSRRVNQALLQVSAVLSPEQRLKLAEQFDKMHAHGRHAH